MQSHHLVINRREVVQNNKMSPEFEAELEALKAVYGEEQVSFHKDTNRLMVRLQNGSRTSVIRCEIPQDYPETAPKAIDDDVVAATIESLFIPGQEVVLQLIESIRESLPQPVEQTKPRSIEKSTAPPKSTPPVPAEAGPVPVEKDLDPSIWAQGEVIVVSKSRFIGHAAVCRSPEEARRLLLQVQNSKHARATHNMWAYRLADGRADNEDDGEQAAGGRLAELLHVLQAKDVLVVVTRYFGGILLGPQRFKIIAQSARSALDALKERQAS